MKAETAEVPPQARSSSHAISGERAPYRELGKRLFDIVFASAMLAAVLPILAALLIAVSLDGGAPLFGHRRVGRGGRYFRCLKVRTMVRDAEARLAGILAADADLAAEWVRSHKLEDDPRVTPLGRFLRRTSLDELPQFWNVLRGDMSLVGPRPVTPDELAVYGPHRDAYLSVRPGVTGLWQVSGRNDLDFDARAELDSAYVRDISLMGDVRIAVRTTRAVLLATGK